MEDVLVSVRMVTYNQEKYIAEAIESVLRQKVNFRYELIIGEDASTDGTAAIVDRYQSEYPDIIRVFHRKKNLGMLENNKRVMRACRGKYVAALAGDDYWVYQYKLQKQVDYLEEHDDVTGTAHNVYSVDDEGREAAPEYAIYMRKGYIYNKWYAMNLKHEVGHTASYVYRNIRYLLGKEQWEAFLNCRLNVDVRVSYTLAMLGKIVYFDEIWSCSRRLLKGDSWLATTYQRNLLYFYFDMDLEACRYLKEVFGVKVDPSNNLRDKLKQADNLAVQTPTKENIAVAIQINIAYLQFLLKKGLRRIKDYYFKK